MIATMLSPECRPPINRRASSIRSCAWLSRSPLGQTQSSGRLAIEIEGDRVVHRRLLRGHPFPRAVVEIDETVQHADVRDARRVRDYLRRCDGAPKRTRVHGGDAARSEEPSSIHGVLIPLRIKGNVPPARDNGSRCSSSSCRAVRGTSRHGAALRVDPRQRDALADGESCSSIIAGPRVSLAPTRGPDRACRYVAAASTPRSGMIEHATIFNPLACVSARPPSRL